MSDIIITGFSPLAGNLSGTPNITVGTIGATAITGSGELIVSAAGAASTPAVSLTGAIYAGGAGSGSTSVPLLYINESSNAPSTWSTGGTAIGVNAPASYLGTFLDFRVNGGNSLFYISSGGSVVSSGSASYAGIITTTVTPNASTSALNVTGAPYTGGTGTTTYPLVYINDGTAPSSWSTAGTLLGFNAPSGFSGNFLDCHINGGSSVFNVNYLGRVTIPNSNGEIGLGLVFMDVSGSGGINNTLYFGNSSGVRQTNVNLEAGGYLGNELCILPLSTPVFTTSSTASTGGSLTGNTTYYYRVAAVDNFGNTTAAFAEQAVTTAAGTNTNTITINWSVPANGSFITTYRVYGRTTGAEQLIGTAGNGNNVTSSFTDTGGVTPNGALPTTNTTGNSTLGNVSEVSVIQLSTPTMAAYATATTGGTLNHSTTYYYRVAAFDNVGTSLASAETSVTTGGAANTCTVTVNWYAVACAVGYNIYGRTTGAELLIGTVYTTSGSLTFVDTGAVTPSGALPTVNTTGNINLSTAQNTYTGSVSGTAVWSMPFQGSSYKKFLITFLALHDAGGTITFPTAFSHTPTVWGDSAVTAVSSANTTTFTIAAAATLSGNVFCEGY